MDIASGYQCIVQHWLATDLWRQWMEHVTQQWDADSDVITAAAAGTEVYVVRHVITACLAADNE